jgi:hypothetical protein
MAIQARVTDCWREPLEDDATIVVLGVAQPDPRLRAQA